MKITCPACGSDSLDKQIKKTIIPIEFGRDISVDETIYTCNICESDGDFAEVNDKIIEVALAKAQKQTTAMIIGSLSDVGISQAYFERSFNLPSRTLARWKKGELSAAGAALLKTVRTFPWLVAVADERFDQHYAIKRMIDESTIALKKIMDPHVVKAEYSQTVDGNTVQFISKLTLQEQAVTKSTGFQYQLVRAKA